MYSERFVSHFGWALHSQCMSMNSTNTYLLNTYRSTGLIIYQITLSIGSILYVGLILDAVSIQKPHKQSTVRFHTTIRSTFHSRSAIINPSTAESQFEIFDKLSIYHKICCTFQGCLFSLKSA